MTAEGCPRIVSKSSVKFLRVIDVAETLDELETLPGWRLRELKGDRAGTWSIVVTRNYRLTFAMEEDQVHDMDLEDYH